MILLILLAHNVVGVDPPAQSSRAGGV